MSLISEVEVSFQAFYYLDLIFGAKIEKIY